MPRINLRDVQSFPSFIQSNIFCFLCPPGPPRRSRAFSMHASSSHRNAANRNLVAGLPHTSHFSPSLRQFPSGPVNGYPLYLCFLFLATVFLDMTRLPSLESASAA